MKTTVLTCLAALTGLLAAEPSPIIEPAKIPNGGPASKPDPHAPARMAVMREIVVRLQPSVPPFSRAMPMNPIPTFRPVDLVDGEKHLPFTIAMGRAIEVRGYIRLSDNVIFIFRPEKKDHVRSTLDPRFAPKKVVKRDPDEPA